MLKTYAYIFVLAGFEKFYNKPSNKKSSPQTSSSPDKSGKTTQEVLDQQASTKQTNAAASTAAANQIHQSSKQTPTPSHTSNQGRLLMYY